MQNDGDGHRMTSGGSCSRNTSPAGSRRPSFDNNQSDFMKQFDNGQNGYRSKSGMQLPTLPVQMPGEMPEMPGQMKSPTWGNGGNDLSPTWGNGGHDNLQETFPGVRRNSNPQ